MNKGFNQIDLVFAVVIIVFMVFLGVYYSSHFIQSPLNRARSLELKYLARGLGDTVFNDLGIPGEWQWSQNNVKPSLGSYIYRVPVHLKEWNGTDNTDAFAFVYLDTGGNAYNSSVIVYDGNETLDTELKDITQDSNGFVDYVNVTFLVNVSSYDEKLVYVYYSGDNETSVSYTSLSDDNNTLNITKISRQRYTGLTTSKMNALGNIPLREAGEKFGVDCPFRLKVEKTGGDWEYGYNLTGAEVSVNRKKILLQNSSGHIESAGAVVYVWK